MWNSYINVIDAAYTIVDQLQIANESMGAMKEIQLSRPEEEVSARASLALKYREAEKQPVTTKQILLPRRFDDGKDDLWTKFNVEQANLMRGGQRGRAASVKRVTTRPVLNRQEFSTK